MVQNMINKCTSAMLIALAIAGCSSSQVTKTRLLDVTIGQQLIDLKKARDVGALSAQEYEDQRAMLIRSVE